MEKDKKVPEFFVTLKDGRWIGKSKQGGLIDIGYPDGLHVQASLEGVIFVMNKEKDWISFIEKEGIVRTGKWSEFQKKLEKHRKAS